MALDLDTALAADAVFRDGHAVAGPVPLSGVTLSITGHVRRALAAVGVKLDDGARAHLVIRARGLALGQLYDYMARLKRHRALRFNGARVEGTMALARADGRRCRVRFAGAVVPSARIPVRFGRDSGEDARLAPFAEAVAAGFDPALAALIGAVWGKRAAAATGLRLGPATRAPGVVCDRASAPRRGPGGRRAHGLPSGARY